MRSVFDLQTTIWSDDQIVMTKYHLIELGCPGSQTSLVWCAHLQLSQSPSTTEMICTTRTLARKASYRPQPQIISRLRIRPYHSEKRQTPKSHVDPTQTQQNASEEPTGEVGNIFAALFLLTLFRAVDFLFQGQLNENSPEKDWGRYSRQASVRSDEQV